jgi:hypothetical protein
VPPQAGWQIAGRYANALLKDLGVSRSVSGQRELHPAQRWAQCGGLVLTGYPEAAQMCPVPLAAYADGVVRALRTLQPSSSLHTLDGAQLLGERAALAGYRRGGDVAPGGSCRWLATADGWLALNLSRTTDWELLPAWLEGEPLADWPAVATALRRHATLPCVERGRLLGLALAPLARATERPVRWYQEHLRSAAAPSRHGVAPVVIDLSALWAGPLCTQLLQMMGARVIKVESAGRPDGMRGAATGFFDLLNAGKASVVLDFSQPSGRDALRLLLLQADIILEASRPRALRQLGICAEEIVRENPAATWLSICGYGRDEPAAQWVAFGDDAAVAGGLSQVLWDCSHRPMFCADAIADPLTGMHAALAAWWSFTHGGGRLLSVALHDVIAFGIQFAGANDATENRATAAAWSASITPADVAPPRARASPGSARPLGADTQAVLATLVR